MLLILLHAAADGPGLKMTATGNLSRAVVAELSERLTWPGFDPAGAFQCSKVTNEPDHYPLFFLRHLLEAATLLRRYKGHFRTTPAGRKMSREPDVRSLAAGALLHVAFWHLDLGYLSWSPLLGWPQRSTGTVLWSLSVAAHDWQSSEHLTRLCTIPTRHLPDRPWDATASAMEGANSPAAALVWAHGPVRRGTRTRPGRRAASASQDGAVRPLALVRPFNSLHPPHRATETSGLRPFPAPMRGATVPIAKGRQKGTVMGELGIVAAIVIILLIISVRMAQEYQRARSSFGSGASKATAVPASIS